MVVERREAKITTASASVVQTVPGSADLIDLVYVFEVWSGAAADGLPPFI